MARKSDKLTKKTLDDLRKATESDPNSTDVFAADAGQPGLYVWARRGRVRFVFVYRPPAGGARKRMQIDTYPAITLDQARAIAQTLRGQVAGGIDPQEARAEGQKAREEEQRNSVTLAKAVELYLEDLRQRAETGARRGKHSGYAGARRLLTLHVVPALGKLRVRDVTADHVRQLHRAMSKTPCQANRALTFLGVVFSFAERSELVPAGYNPARHVERYREEGVRRALSAAELTALGTAIYEAERDATLPPVAILTVRLLALTGFRRSELLGHAAVERRSKLEGLRWGDVDLTAGVIHLRDSKTGRQDRVIGRAAVDLLRAARESAGDPGPSDPVCPGALPGCPYIAIDAARRKLWLAAGIEGVDLHSLRHSFASLGAHVEGGRYAGHVGPLLGHGYQSRGITERYIHSNPEALRPAADAIAGEVARVLALPAGAR